jgi:hypothetical protein
MLNEFGIPVKLVRLIKMYLNKSYSKVCIGKNLSDALPIQNGLKQQCSLPLLFNFTSEHVRVLEFDSWLGLGIFFFTTASRTALGPTQPSIQWVPRALSLGVKWPGCEADHSSPSSAKVKKCMELYLHSPNTPSWHGAQLKKAQGQLYLYHQEGPRK